MDMKIKTDALLAPPGVDRRGDAAGTALAAGGLLAAFGVASCCALPIALSTLGISAASLVGIGYLAAPYQRELFYLAVACLAGAGVVAWRQWRARARGACAAQPARGRLIMGWMGIAAIMLATMLLVLTFWYEPPI
ncbi:MAG: mercury transporter MerT [Reyranella sp.]|nr:mercury transporter MerT [Reyranella sp.]